MKKVYTFISPAACQLKVDTTYNAFYRRIMLELWSDESFYSNLVYQIVYDLNSRKSYENS